MDIWRDPFARGVIDNEGYQIAQIALRAGRRRGARGRASASRCWTSPAAATIIPAPDTDLIYAVIANELGLVGACGVVFLYLLIAERGFRIAQLARDSFSTLLAAGLTAVFALQVFVIVGGVTKVIPLTGVTLPFISYGGSSIVANFVLLALLLLVSDRARATAMNTPILRLYGLVLVLFSAPRLRHVVVDGVRRRAAAGEPEQPPRAARAGQDRARHDHGARRQGARAQRAVGGRHLPPHLPGRRPVQPRRSATRSPTSAGRASSSTATPS